MPKCPLRAKTYKTVPSVAKMHAKMGSWAQKQVLNCPFGDQMLVKVLFWEPKHVQKYPSCWRTTLICPFAR